MDWMDDGGSAMDSIIAALDPDSPMMRLLARDTGSQFTVLEYLILNDMGMLARCCHTWRRWLAAPVAFSPRLRDVIPSRMSVLLAAPWACRRITCMNLQDDFLNDDAVDRSDRSPQLILEEALDTIARVFRLEYFQFWTRAPKINAACFEGFVQRMQGMKHFWLFLNAPVKKGGNDEIAITLLNSIGSLQKLRAFKLVGHIVSPIRLPFDQLSKLPELQTVLIMDTEVADLAFRASLPQVECLAKCTKLTELAAGLWDPPPELVAKLRASQSASFSASFASASSSASSALALEIDSYLASHIGRIIHGCPGMKRITLRQSSVHAPLWRKLIAGLSPTLISLWPQALDTFEPEDWSLLAKLTSLRNLRISPLHHVRDDASHGRWTSFIKVSDFLPHLITLKSLQQVVFGTGLKWSREELQGLCANLPALWLLAFQAVFFESLQPLAAAPLLRDLQLIDCTALEGAPLLVRTTLPAIPLLSELNATEPFQHQLSAEEAAPLNQLLFQRCPLLKPNKFKQNIQAE